MTKENGIFDIKEDSGWFEIGSNLFRNYTRWCRKIKFKNGISERETENLKKYLQDCDCKGTMQDTTRTDDVYYFWCLETY